MRTLHLLESHLLLTRNLLFKLTGFIQAPTLFPMKTVLIYSPRSLAMSSSLSHGLVTKSSAPRFIASTASGTSPKAVISTTAGHPRTLLCVQARKCRRCRQVCDYQNSCRATQHRYCQRKATPASSFGSPTAATSSNSPASTIFRVVRTAALSSTIKTFILSIPLRALRLSNLNSLKDLNDPKDLNDLKARLKCKIN